MDDRFDSSGPAALPWGPFALWQANWQMLNQWQQAWLHLCLPGAAGKLPGMPAGWPGPEALLAALAPFLPKIEASVVPVEPEGRLAGADRAARLTLRMTLPGGPAFGQGEVLLVDAVVAHAAGRDAARLGGGGHPAGLSGKR